MVFFCIFAISFAGKMFGCLIAHSRVLWETQKYIQLATHAAKLSIFGNNNSPIHHRPTSNNSKIKLIVIWGIRAALHLPPTDCEW